MYFEIVWFLAIFVSAGSSIRQTTKHIKPAGRIGGGAGGFLAPPPFLPKKTDETACRMRGGGGGALLARIRDLVDFDVCILKHTGGQEYFLSRNSRILTEKFLKAIIREEYKT